jgi:hypothetical protein
MRSADALVERGDEIDVLCVMPGNDAGCLKRLPANSSDDTLFRAKLEGCCDWLKPPQHAFQRRKPQFLDSRARGNGSSNSTGASLN